MQVTLNPPESPSQQAVAKAAAEVTVTDATGRKITLRKPGVLAQYRLIEMLGDTAKNGVYVRMALPMMYVATIDGDPVAQPARKSELEALIQRLEEPGVACVMEGVAEHFDKADAEADKAAIKN